MTRAYAPELLLVDGEWKRGKAVIASEWGEIAAIADAAEAPEATPLPGRAMLPGLINAHSHAFQRVFRGATETRSSSQENFWSWRTAMYRAANSLDSEALYRAARMAFLEMALSGITTVGEFHYIHREANGQPYENPNLLALEMVRAAREVGLRICLLRVAYARAGFQKTADPLQARFIEDSPGEFIRNADALRKALDGRFAWAGVAPHSVRAVPLPYLREVCAWAAEENLPIHMHVAEQPDELEECRLEYGHTPVAMLAREGILSARFTAVHGIHVTSEEITAMGNAGTTVCACPTTERNLADGVVPAQRLLEAGAHIALGSDSHAQIDILEDARELEYHLRLQTLERAIIPPRRLWECATISGARSLQVPENAADFFTVDLRDPSIVGASEKDLLAAIVFGLAKSAVRDVIVGGSPIVRDGYHAAQEEIVSEFLEVGK